MGRGVGRGRGAVPGGGSVPGGRIRGGILLAVLAALSAGCEEPTFTTLEVAVVDVSPADLDVIQGDRYVLTATPRAAEGQSLAGREIAWTSTDPGVAAVDANGEVEGRAPGYAEVRATTEGITGSARVTVHPGRVIELSSSALALDAVAGEPDPAEAAVQIENGGAGELTGLSAEAADPDGGTADWLEGELASTSAPTTLTVRASGEGLAPGSYEGRLLVGAQAALNSPAELEVTLEVREPAPILAVEPSSLQLSAQAGAHEPAPETLSITNEGGGNLDDLETSVRYTRGAADGWLSVSLRTREAPTTASLSASARHLPAGNYAAVVRISSDVAENGSVEVEVAFTVGGASQSEAP